MIGVLIPHIIAIIALLINCTVIYITFPKKYNLIIYIGTLTLFTVSIYAYDFLTDNLGFSAGGIRGVLYLPLIIWLLKGPVFQKTFIVFFQLLITMLLAYIAEAALRLLLPQGSGVYYIAVLIASIIIYTAYVILMAREGRRFISRLFASGHPNEWTLYTLGVVFSFVILALIRNAAIAPILYLLLLLFIAWSLAMLCFAIINTHEKSKQRYEADFAREVISSGREHYQKMVELYDTLAILRHDYKYHLNTISELVMSEDTEDIKKYLNSVKAQLPENELQYYCSNSVLNALLVSYANRCAKLGIEFNVRLAMPETLSVPNYDMCIVLGNLLENAVEACQKLTKLKQEHQRNIDLVVKQNKMQLLIMVKNSFDGLIMQSEGQPASTKKDGGFGLRSVRAVAARYDGYLITEYDSEAFTAYVAVQL